jgi:hypothetical protein
MLEDGVPYGEIIRRLGRAGKGISEQAIRRWRKGGHQEWLEEERRLEAMRINHDSAWRIVKEDKGKVVQEAGLQIAATHIYEILTAFDPSTLNLKLKGNPENYARIVNVLARISDGGLRFERYRAEVAERKAKIEQAIKRAREGGGISPETLDLIEQQIKLL